MAHFVRTRLEALAPRHGARVVVEPRYGYVGYIVFANGRRTMFREGSFDVNGQAAANIAKDKGFAAHFLAEAGLPTPNGVVVASAAHLEALALKSATAAAATPGAADAAAFAASCGYPVFVKPNDGAEGRHVAQAGDAAALARALERVFGAAPLALVQARAPGADLRLLVYDGAVRAAYLRRPFTVTGDGRRAIRTLAAEALSARAAPLVNLDDPRIAEHLAAQGRALDDVLAAGAVAPLFAAANLSLGGAAEEATGACHPALEAAALRAAAALGLRFAGVDLLVDGPIGGVVAPPFTVLEVNAAPGLQHYAALGPAAAQRAEGVLGDILRDLADAAARP